MDRRRIIQVVVTAVVGLLVLPVAINVGTGGEAPVWLRPYVGLLWPTVVVGVVLVIALEIWVQLPRRQRAPSALRVHASRNPARALDQVLAYVEDRQRGSLAERVRLALALDELPSAVRPPPHLVQRVGVEEFQLSDGVRISDVFDELDESMLILGAPGSGKTTQVLDLAASIARRSRAAESGVPAPPAAEQRLLPGIPLVLDLADWSRPRRRWSRLLRPGARGQEDFLAWLLRSVRRRYRIPEAVARPWLEENRLVLLLDGLDEVRESDRVPCVKAINDLQQQCGATRLVVCAREADYRSLGATLQLQGAVVIRPLTRAQVEEFIQGVTPRLGGLTASVLADQEISDLVSTPLMVNILVLAYEHQAPPQLHADGDPAEVRRLIFDTYVIEMLARSRRRVVRDPERFLRGLQRLADVSSRLDIGVRVSRLTGDSAVQTLVGPIRAATALWLVPLTAGIGGIASVVAVSRAYGVALDVVLGLLAAGVVSLVSYMAQAGDAPIGRWSALLCWLALAVLVTGAFTSLLSLWLPSLPLPAPWAVGAALALAAVLLGAKGRSGAQADRDFYLLLSVGVAPLALAYPLLGEVPSARPAWAAGFGSALVMMTLWTFTMGGPREEPASASRALHVQVAAIVGVIVVTTLVLARPRNTPFWAPLCAWLLGVLPTVVGGLVLGVLLSAPLVRVAMLVAGEPNPWRRGFLRFAVDRTFLMSAEGEYRFVHLLVREHLAHCDPGRLGPLILQRQEQVGSARQPIR